MKITCPTCTTSYQVPDDYIGDAGRAVRCANCGETWQVEPSDEESPQSAPDIEAGLDTSQDDIDALFDTPAEDDGAEDDGGEEQSQDDIDALFDEPSSAEDQSQDDIDALFDGPGEEAASDEGENDQGDIDALFDEDPVNSDEAGPSDVVTSDAMVPAADDMDDGAVVDMMDASSFEAAKAVARGRDIESVVRKNKKKGKKRRTGGSIAHGVDAHKSRQEWMIGGAALGLFCLLAVGLLLAQKHIVRVLPDLASLYEMVGMPVNLGGVDFDHVDVQLVQKSGAPTIAVEAELVNPGKEAVLLPSLQFSVLGNDDVELYSWVIGPDGVGLGPGERKVVKTAVAAPAQAKQLSLRVFEQK